MKLGSSDFEDILSHYDLVNTRNIKFLSEGYYSHNFKLSINNEKFVIKLFNSRSKPLFCLKLHEKLSGMNFKTATPIRTNQDNLLLNYKNKSIAIFEYLEGEVIDKPNIQDISLLGKNWENFILKPPI